MAAKTLQQILGYVSLTGVIQAIKTGIPDNLPTAFHSITKQVIGDSGRYTVVKGTRRIARLGQYGSPSVKRALKDVADRDIKLMWSFEHIEMKPLLLQQLRNYDNYDLQRLGIDEVDRQQSEFRIYFDNLEMATLYSMLANGQIYFDRDGNLLPSSTGSVETIDYLISSNNKGHLNGIITASWANYNTDIPSQIRNLRLRAAELTGYPLVNAYYGVNIPSYLTQNNFVLDYLSRNPTFAVKYLQQAEIPDGLFGLTWIPVYTSFFEDQNGVNQTFFGGDTVVFTPEIDRTVYEKLLGSAFVPTTFNAAADAAAALASMKQVWGMYSYGVPIHDPVTVRLFEGDVFIPAWKIPDTLFIATVNP
jgi:hypothetical protein